MRRRKVRKKATSGRHGQAQTRRGRRQTIVALFADVVGCSEISNRKTLAKYNEFLDAFHACFEQVCSHHARLAEYDTTNEVKWEKRGDEGCLKTLGCKGEVTFGDCPIRMKNVFDDGTANNWCVGGPGGAGQGWWNPVYNIADARHPCQGCIQPGFPDFPELADDGTDYTVKFKIKGFYNKIG